MPSLDIVVTATDRATGTIKSIDSRIQGMAGRAQTRLGGLGRALGIGLAGAATVGAAALGGAVVGMSRLVSLGSDAEEMMGKFNTVFGEFATDTIMDLDKLAFSVGRNKFDLREFASTFQDTFVPLGFARGEAANLSVELSKLTVDLASFNNMAEPDVLRALQSALVGNHETMRQFGVIITQATLDAELLRMGIEGGTKAASEQEKVMARLNLIMAGTTDAQGDAIRTAGSWANQMRALNATLQETGTAIGSAILPVLTPLLEQFRDLVGKIAPRVVVVAEDIAERMGEWIPNAFAALHETLLIAEIRWRIFWENFSQQILRIRIRWAIFWENFRRILGTETDESSEEWSGFWGDFYKETFGTLQNIADAIESGLRIATGILRAWELARKGEWHNFWVEVRDIFGDGMTDALMHMWSQAYQLYASFKAWWDSTFGRLFSFLGNVNPQIGTIPDWFQPQLAPTGPGGGSDFGSQSNGMTVVQNFNSQQNDPMGVYFQTRDGVVDALRRTGR